MGTDRLRNWLRPGRKKPAVEPSPASSQESSDTGSQNARSSFFVGRTQELDGFARLLREQREFKLLLVTGPAGTGKRSLMREYRRACLALKMPCGVVADFAEPRLDELLRRCAEAMDETRPNSFKAFDNALNTYRTKLAGRKTLTESALNIGREIAVEASGALPYAGGKAANVLRGEGVTGALGTVASRLTGPGDMAAVIDAFCSDLRKLAEPPNSAAALFLDNLHTGLEQPERRQLLQQLTVARVMVVATTDDARLREKLPSDVRDHCEVEELRAFTPEESRSYVTGVIGITGNDALVDEIVERSSGSPQKLSNYRLYYDQHPEARAQPRIPALANASADAGEIYELLQEVADDTHRQLIVRMSPLRWFNAPLLCAVAREAQQSSGEGQAATAADLLRRDRRPSWFRPFGEGWGFNRHERRRLFVEELRRLDPQLYSQVHRAGAEYHFAQLMSWEPTLAPNPHASITDMRAYRSALPFEDRFDNTPFTSALVEWVYHMLALDPVQGCQIVAENSAEAIFHGKYAVAMRLLECIADVPLQRRQRLCLEPMVRFAQELERSNFVDGARLAEELLATGTSTLRSKAVLQHMLGYCEWQINQLGDAASHLEEAYATFERIAEPDKSLTAVRCINITWVALARVSRDGVAAKWQDLFAHALALAVELGDVGVVGELYRAQGILYVTLGDFAGAEDHYRKALVHFENARSPKDVALVRRDLGDGLLSRIAAEEIEGAEKRAFAKLAARELDRSAAIYAQLEDSESAAGVAVLKLKAHYLCGEPAKGSEDQAEALRLAGKLPGLGTKIRIDLVNALVDVARVDDARALCQEAAALAAPGAYATALGYAFYRVGEIPEAIKHLKQSVEQSPTDTEPQLGLARMYAGQGETRLANEVFERAERQMREDVDRLPQNAEVHARLGMLLLERSDYSGAEAEFRSAVALKDDGLYRLRIAQCLIGAGDRETEAADALVASMPQVAALAYLRNDLLREINRLGTDDGIRVLEAASRAAPNQPEFRYRLAGKLRDRARETSSRPSAMTTRPGLIAGRSPGAAPDPGQEVNVQDLTERERALLPRTQEQGSAVLPALSVGEIGSFTRPSEEQPVHAADEDVRTALAELRAAVIRAPKNLTYLLELTRVLIDLRNWDDAESAIVRAAEVEPGNADVAKLLARIKRRESWERDIPASAFASSPLVKIQVSSDLESWVLDGNGAATLFYDMLSKLTEQLDSRVGIAIFSPATELNRFLPPRSFLLLLRDIPRYLYTMKQDYVAQISPTAAGLTAGGPGEEATLPWDGSVGSWVSAAEAKELSQRRVSVWDPRGYIADCLMNILQLNAAELLDFQDVDNKLESLDAPRETIDFARLHLARFTTVLRRLLSERVPIASLDIIAKKFATCDPQTDIYNAVEAVRSELAQSTAVTWPPTVPETAMVLMSEELESAFFQQNGSIEQHERLSFVRMQPPAVQDFFQILRQQLDPGVSVVIVNDSARRPHIRNVIELEFPHLAVLSARETTGVDLQQLRQLVLPATEAFHGVPS